MLHFVGQVGMKTSKLGVEAARTDMILNFSFDRITLLIKTFVLFVFLVEFIRHKGIVSWGIVV